MEDLDDKDKEEMFTQLDILLEYLAFLFDLDNETAAAVLDEWRKIRKGE